MTETPSKSETFSQSLSLTGTPSGISSQSTSGSVLLLAPEAPSALVITISRFNTIDPSNSVVFNLPSNTARASASPSKSLNVVSSAILLEVTSEEDTLLGIVKIPAPYSNFTVNLAHTVVIQNGNPDDGSSGNLVSDVITVTLIDQENNSITDLTKGDVTICLTATKDVQKEEVCLSFFNVQTLSWECEDKCLERDENNMLCGDTSHFTSFALLLTGQTGNEECDKLSREDVAISFTSLAVLIIAGVVIVVSVVGWEIRVRHKAKAVDRSLRQYAKLQGTLTGTNPHKL